VQSAGVNLVAALHANSSVPNSVITKTVSSINEMSECACDYLKQEIANTVKDTPCMTESVVKCTEVSVDNVCRPLDFLSSQHKQDAFFLNHPLFVQSESIPLGCRYEVRSGRNDLVYDCYEYVSVENTVRSLLQSSHYVQMLVKFRECGDDMLCHFADGT